MQRREFIWLGCGTAVGVMSRASVTSADEESQGYQPERFLQNPIITPSMLGQAGDNINGPSLIKAPDWLRNKLGTYYLYFGHHRGRYIRLAYADDLRGPWKIYEPGVVHAQHAGWNPDHVASPEVLVDNERQEILLYFHAPVTAPPYTRQDTFLAISKLDFGQFRQPPGERYFAG